MPTPLQTLAQELASLATQQKDIHYRLPSLWAAPSSTPQILEISNPASYYCDLVRDILAKPYHATKHPQSGEKLNRDEWLDTAVVYSMLLRHTTAFDHDGNGMISTTLNRYGWRETGSFIKSIALLPYLQSLGINTLYLLPLTAIGRVHQKGNLGSPYAIRNPYKLDEHLAEPILNLSAEQQFAAFVEACHRCGIRVITEFALRTASRDCDWAVEHPDWFYWIEVNETEQAFTPPMFSEEDLRYIRQKVEAKDFTNLPKPNTEYRSRFTPTPIQCWREKDGTIIGRCDDGRLCTLPGAFADYPPDDNQPLWSDVTYLRLHTHPDFNYVAYNTIRMYDDELQKTEWINAELWEALSQVIPYYKKQFGIDGVVLDMSHALPQELRQRIIYNARRDSKRNDKNNEDESFVLIEENFSVNAESKQLGFDAVVGDVWLMEQEQYSTEQLLQRIKSEYPPLRYLATAETHNTPRIAARHEDWRFAALLFFLNRHLPKGIPTILSGAELGETIPINTGLGFRSEELPHYPADILPLFSAVAMNWLPDTQLLNFLQGLASSRQANSALHIQQVDTHDKALHIRITANGQELSLNIDYATMQWSIA